jgi:hypothetical protein
VRLTIQSEGGGIELRALTWRRMRNLTGLAVGVSEALGVEQEKKPFGFKAGTALETEIVED